MESKENKYNEPPSYIGDISNTTLYDAYINANKDNLEAIAVYTLDGQTYSHKEIVRMIDSVAKNFWNMGIREGDKVGILTNNTIEEVVSLLALNRIGAIAVFVDISKEIADVRESILMHEFKVLIIDENVLIIEPAINVCGIPIIVAGEGKNYSNGKVFDELYMCEEEKEFHEVKIGGMPAVIINSSGTTGKPKPIVHTNNSVNMAAYKILCTDFSLTRENIIMKVIPSYIGLGLVTTLYTALLSGTKVVLINGINPPRAIENTTKFILGFSEFRNQVGLDENTKLIVFAAPMFFRVLVDNISDSDDLSYIGTMLAAGSKMGKQELEILHSKLRQVNCHVKICNGYGQNEMCGAVTLNINAANKEGSAGFPVRGTSICIVDPYTLEEENVNKEGLVLERSETQFLRYENMPEETENAFITLKDGTVWFNTKDIGYLDEDGFLYITGRMSRVLIRYDCKIPIDRVEEKIKNYPTVFDCAIVVSKKNEVEEAAIAYVSLKGGVAYTAEKFLMEIQASQFPLSELEIPDKFIFVSQLPYMENGKVDYRTLEERENEVPQVKGKNICHKSFR